MDAYPAICMYRAKTEEQVKGYAKAEYKKFSNEEDARTYLYGPREVTEGMSQSDSESHMDERTSYSQYVGHSGLNVPSTNSI